MSNRPIAVLLKRVRWAIALAMLQGVIFVVSGISEHQKHAPQSPEAAGESYGCIILWYSPSVEWYNEMALDQLGSICVTPGHIRVLQLLNLPVFVVSGVLLALSSNLHLNQVWLFYGFNGLGIPLFWYWIGRRIDRRLRRGPGNAASPP